MALVITKQTLKTAYEYLQSTKPFAGWHLPTADEVVFGLIQNRDRCGHHFLRSDGRHTIELSTRWNTRHIMILSTMAHEMCHIRMHETRQHSQRNPHNAAFGRLADRVCKIHLEFDRMCF